MISLHGFFPGLFMTNFLSSLLRCSAFRHWSLWSWIDSPSPRTISNVLCLSWFSLVKPNKSPSSHIKSTGHVHRLFCFTLLPSNGYDLSCHNYIIYICILVLYICVCDLYAISSTIQPAKTLRMKYSHFLPWHSYTHSDFNCFMHVYWFLKPLPKHFYWRTNGEKKLNKSGFIKSWSFNFYLILYNGHNVWLWPITDQ